MVGLGNWEVQAFWEVQLGLEASFSQIVSPQGLRNLSCSGLDCGVVGMAYLLTLFPVMKQFYFSIIITLLGLLQMFLFYLIEDWGADVCVHADHQPVWFLSKHSPTYMPTCPQHGMKTTSTSWIATESFNRNLGKVAQDQESFWVQVWEMWVFFDREK